MEGLIVRRDDDQKLEHAMLDFVDEGGWRRYLRAMRVGFASELEKYEPTDLDESLYATFKMAAAGSTPFAYVVVAPRGVGPHKWDQSEKKQVQHRRRFMLLGETLESAQAWDARRAADAACELLHVEKPNLWVDGRGEVAAPLLIASTVERFGNATLWDLDITGTDRAALLNVDRLAGPKPVLALALENCPICLVGGNQGEWEFPRAVAKVLGWQSRLIAGPKPMRD